MPWIVRYRLRGRNYIESYKEDQLSVERWLDYLEDLGCEDITIEPAYF